jgi:hypothetical protein
MSPRIHLSLGGVVRGSDDVLQAIGAEVAS